MLTHLLSGRTSSAHGIQGEYDIALVILSIVVCSIAAGQALRHAAFARQSTSSAIRNWSIATGSLALGIGIWAMHFIGMLAYSFHTTAQFDWLLTIFSILPGIAASAVALTLLSRHELQTKQLLIGGAIVCMGIATMHYSGMAALKMSVKHEYSAAWFAISLLLGFFFATLALWIHFGVAQVRTQHLIFQKSIAAIIMGAAIAGMHYTAMLALKMPHSTQLHHTTSTEEQLILALTIALITTVIGGIISQANALIHYRDRWQKADMNEARLQALVTMAADGIICIDRTGTVTDYNPAAQKIFGWSPSEVLGENVKMLMPTALSSQHDNYLERHEESQRNAAPPLKNKISEVLGQHKDGTLIPLRLALSQAETRGHRMYVGVLTDLSNSKRTERQLHIAATVFESFHEGLVVLDANRNIADMNPEFSRRSEINRQAAKNKDFSSFFLGEEDAADTQWRDIWVQVAKYDRWDGFLTLKKSNIQLSTSITSIRDEQQRLHHYIAVFHYNSNDDTFPLESKNQKTLASLGS